MQIIDSIAEEEKKKKEREEQERKDAIEKEIKRLQDSSVLFNKICERTINSKANFHFLNNIDAMDRLC